MSSSGPGVRLGALVRERRTSPLAQMLLPLPRKGPKLVAGVTNGAGGGSTTGMSRWSRLGPTSQQGQTGHADICLPCGPSSLAQEAHCLAEAAARLGSVCMLRTSPEAAPCILSLTQGPSIDQGQGLPKAAPSLWPQCFYSSEAPEVLLFSEPLGIQVGASAGSSQSCLETPAFCRIVHRC